MSEICKKCGGVKNLHISDMNTFDQNRFSSSVPIRVCSCPPKPQAKHDGNLGDGDKVEYTPKPNLIMFHNYRDSQYFLYPRQALLLLAWLKQEEANLQKMVEEGED